MDETKNKINTVKAIKHGFIIPIKKWKTLSIALLPSGIAILALDLIFDFMITAPSISANIIYILLSSVFTVIFAITCHRNVLLGIGSTTKYGVLNWSFREWRYAGWALIAYFYLYTFMALGVYIASLLINFLPGPHGTYYFIAFMGITMLPGVYVFARLSILFPATAIEQKTTWNWTWDATEGNGWRLVIIVGLFPAVLFTVPALFSGINIVLDIAAVIFGLALLVIETTALSVSFKELIKTREPRITEDHPDITLISAKHD